MKLQKIMLQLALLWAIVSCHTMTPEPKMSFEEARDVVLSMQSVPMEPPPRKMDDILAVLKIGPDTNTDALKDLILRADMTPPDQKGAQDLYQFFRARGDARYQLSRFDECRADIRTAIAYGQQADIDDRALQQRLAELEMLAGRYVSALEFSTDLINANVRKVSGWRVGPCLAFQSRVHHRMGNFFRANIAIRNAKAAYRKVPAWARISNAVYGGVMDMGGENDILAAEAEMLEAQGRYEQAHVLRTMVLNYHYSKRKLKPLGSVHAQMALAANLMHQGRLILAEKEARAAVMGAVLASGKQSGMTADAIQALGEIILAKGDLQNADILSTVQIDILTRLGLSFEEDIMVRARLFQARVLVSQEDFSAAMAAYDLALKGMSNNPYFVKRYAHGNLGLILCLIRNDRAAEAQDLLFKTNGSILNFGVAASFEKAPIQALEAMVLYENRQTDPALDRFNRAAPGLAAILQDPDSAFELRRLADILLRVYIDMLLELNERGGYQARGIDVADEIFKLSDTQSSRVNDALGQSSARAASLTDPVLAELVRQEQDAGQKIKSLQAVLLNAAAASGDNSNSPLAALERSIRSLTKARAAIAVRIESDFPRYGSYVHPTPPTMAQVQAQLAPHESFVGIWTLPDKTCVWAIPPEGKPAFAVVALGEPALREKVSALRNALKPDARRIREIPEFDLTIAYQLYQGLLEPVASGWHKAEDLLVVIKGPADQIPLSVLPTEPAKPMPASDVWFDSYRSVPWLIRKVSIARLPSAASLITLRSLPPGQANREAFAGFGDPIFSLGQMTPQEANQPRVAARIAGGKVFTVRGIRISQLGPLDSFSISSVAIEDLSRLPDTADEITGIAASLGADPSTDVFLGKAASETRVKTADLSRKKVLAFATHALLPGDLDGLTQPALAFSSPQITKDDEDGLLTVGEILTLKLDADLVVLSACDTGAGDGGGSEAVSGLGRAFFYSGARALLVTMWPVETTSANKLTTELFRYQKEDKSLSRARALKNSMLKLMHGPGMKDPASGKIVASYAHPFFWAPFVIVGDTSSSFD